MLARLVFESLVPDAGNHLGPDLATVAPSRFSQSNAWP